MRTPTASPWARAGTRLLFSAAGGVGRLRLPILIFHRVHREPDPLFPDEMDAARFDRLLAQLAAVFRVQTLGRGADRLRAGDLPARSLAITFDDGYADNAEVALPVLRRHRLPATFFVASGFLDGGRMWNDSVIEALRVCDRSSIELDFLGLGTLPLQGLADRRRAIEAVLPLVKYQGLSRREEILDRLLFACGRPPLPTSLMMRSEQVRELSEAGMEIGAHTVRHPILAELPLDEAAAELREGRRQLQALTGAPVDVLAYPNGCPDRDYAADHVRLARELGFRYAVSTAPGIARGDDDPHQLPRFTPWDRDPTRWMLRLRWMYRRPGARASASAA